MNEEKFRLLDRLYETFPTTNKSRILEMYLNIILVLEGARPSYCVDIIPPKLKTRYDFIDIVLEVYPNTFEILCPKVTPFIFLKSNSLFIAATLETIIFKNIGTALGYCCPIDEINSDSMKIRLNILANKINKKMKTRIYSFLVPISMLDETIMSSVNNKVENYNKILNEYGYFVSLESEILWSQNNIRMVDCESLNKTS